MKKSEINVSMPMTTYEELMNFRTLYTELCSKIRLCFTIGSNEAIISFDTTKALNLCKKFLPDRYNNANFNKIE